MSTPNPPANDGHSGSSRPVGPELLPPPDPRLTGRQPVTEPPPASSVQAEIRGMLASGNVMMAGAAQVAQVRHPAGQAESKGGQFK